MEPKPVPVTASQPIQVIPATPAQAIPVTSSVPWWLELIKQHGISTGVLLLLLMGPGRQFFDAHMAFVTSQGAQMMLQTQALRTIAESAKRQEDSLQLINKRLDEHSRILETFRK